MKAKDTLIVAIIALVGCSLLALVEGDHAFGAHIKWETERNHLNSVIVYIRQIWLLHDPEFTNSTARDSRFTWGDHAGMCFLLISLIATISSSSIH